ncbi:MAG TPA: TIGR03750 family conjugal transfer protein [Legionella sp.]|nr:TIGR03750 family conjugal transfer protein [Legionella sp.]
MKAPSSRHLSHDFPAYKGLTLRELFVIVVTATVFTCCLFSAVGLMTSWVVAFACIGFLVGFIVAITLLPKPIACLKAGKPHGYLMKVLTLTLVRFRLKQSPYLHYTGLWNRCKHV